MASEKKGKAIDLSHHLSIQARSRAISPLKGLQKYWGVPGIISLAGGLPSPVYFPFSNISGDALVADTFPATQSERPSSLSWLWKYFSSPKERTTFIQIPKYPAHSDELNLASALQYSRATGILSLQAIMQEFAARVYQPAYIDFKTLAHTGNTDGWHRVVVTLCNPGEGVLAGVWTYPSAMSTMQPYGVTPVPIALDSQGIRSDSLRVTLAQWDPSSRGGMPRPHVLYTVPIGQNPTGATMGIERKKEIYEICVEYDVIIVEDDPYYFLQEGTYVPKAQRDFKAKHKGPTDDDELSFLETLVPSFLKIDREGRVIRLDSFSKTIAPGCRLGWFTCNPLFSERLEREGETSTQAPCGFGQSLVTKLLITWKYQGYIRWLQALGVQYTQRRDYIIDCLAEEFNLVLLKSRQGYREGSDVYHASLNQHRLAISEKSTSTGQTLFSFVPPTSGMFVWIKMHFENFPSLEPEEETLEMQLFVKLAEAGVLLAPGFIFSADHQNNAAEGHLRISFSNSEFEEMKKAVAIFGKVVREFLKEN